MEWGYEKQSEMVRTLSRIKQALRLVLGIGLNFGRISGAGICL